MLCQQDAIYLAQEALPRGREFTSLEEIQRWVDDLRDTWWWPTRYAIVERVEVGPARPGARYAVGWYEKDRFAGRMELAPNKRFSRTVIHELAHIIAEAIHGSKSHDPWFAREYINLMYLIEGEEMWRRLEAAFVVHGIDYTPPKEEG